MSDPRRRVSAIIHERFADKLVELSQVMNQTPNHMVNRLVEESIEQIFKKTVPTGTLATVTLARLMMRRNLSYGDRLLQDILAGFIDNWADYQADWRAFVLDEANALEVPLTREILDKIKKRADKRANEAAAEKRAARKRSESKSPS